MRFLSSLRLIVAAPVLVSGSAYAVSHAEPKTEAAVLAADDEWLASERRGDVATLNNRLADSYEDIAPDGRSHPKARLLAATANLKTPATGTVAEVAAAFHKQHPTIEKVVIAGNTAILTFSASDPKLGPVVRAADVFTYKDGMWRAILSTHTPAPSPTGS